MDRRDFLKSTAAVAVAASGAEGLVKAAERAQTALPEEEVKQLLASAPMLQNYAETSVGVAFAVNAPEHVQVAELLVLATHQASGSVIHRE